MIFGNRKKRKKSAEMCLKSAEITKGVDFSFYLWYDMTRNKYVTIM